jgi:hypothetical protein
MQRNKQRSPLTLVVAFIVLAVVVGTSGWVFLETLPSRQLARLPKVVQNWVISEPESAVLPAADVAVDTGALLAAAGDAPLRAVESAETSQTAAQDDAVAKPAPPSETPAEAVATLPPPTATPLPEPTATPEPTAVPLPEFVRLEGFTHQTQDWNNCGPATLAMSLSYFGATLTQYDTAPVLKPNEEDRNVTPQEMAAFVDERTDYRALHRVNGSLDRLKALLAAGFPVIIEIGLDPPGEVAWLEWYGHYLLATGYDDASEALWVFDSLVWSAESLIDENSPDGKPYSYAELEQYWPHFNNTYIVLYTPDQESTVLEIIGDDVDDVKMWQNALLNAQQAITAVEDDAFAWFNLGSAFANLGRYEEAAAAYDKARAIGLPWRMLWYQFGPYEAYYQTGRYVDVVLLANLTLNDRPYFEESFYYRGLAQNALGDVENARASLQAAVDFNPNFAPAAAALAALSNN